ncbi:MAG: hypothetical protein AAGH76_10620 [Pseudomonadota bacterium]
MTTNYIKSKLAFIGFTVLLVGCASTVSSSRGLYGPTPANVRSSDEKALFSFDVSGHEINDIRYAVKEAAGLDGLLIDVDQPNMVSGYGLSSGSQAQRCPKSRGYTFAAYFEETSNSRAKVTIAVDAHGGCWMDGQVAQYVGQKLMANTKKILLSYE